MKAGKINPRSIGVEGPFISTDVVVLADLKNALLEAGEPPSVGNGIVGWLIDKAVGNPDLTSATTRSRYRRTLQALVDAGYHPPISGPDNGTLRYPREAIAV